MSGYCDIAPGHPLHGPYHDTEYGVPARDEAALFERLVLEINQAGLSWETMLKKREGFRSAYDGFDVDKVAAYGEADRERLLNDAGIIRNRLKVNALVTNAQVFLTVQKEFGSFDAYLWRFVDGKPIDGNWKRVEDVPATTPISDALSKDLKKRGFKYLGSITVYSHLQACGMINDHGIDCSRYAEINSRYPTVIRNRDHEENVQKFR